MPAARPLARVFYAGLGRSADQSAGGGPRLRMAPKISFSQPQTNAPGRALRTAMSRLRERRQPMQSAAASPERVGGDLRWIGAVRLIDAAVLDGGRSC